MSARALVEALAGSGQPFALLRRASAGHQQVEVLRGDVVELDGLADLPLPSAERPPGGMARSDLLALVPYRQITERGYACNDDGTPLLALRVFDEHRVDSAELLAGLPRAPAACVDGRFDVDDGAYAATVEQVIRQEISRGEGANFVIMRSYLGHLADFTVDTALSVFGRLVRSEQGAYWVFLIHTGDRTLVGASPERHVSLADDVVSMNPISGTYRYPPGGHGVPDLVRFLNDRKESDELAMVVDEELKMISRIADGEVRLTGPMLKEMSFLAHTEYLLSARTSLEPADLIRETMFAPTVTGSPLRNACRVIERYEDRGRGYYSGVAALIGRTANGSRTLDAPILIRTAEIDRAGAVRLGVGATIVRHSRPTSEQAETRAKAAALLAALGAAPAVAQRAGSAPRLAGYPAVRRALADRNDKLARFWLGTDRERGELPAGSVLVVDAEDGFSAMLAHQLRAIGLSVVVRPCYQVAQTEPFDLVVLGPGPGDPRSTVDRRVVRLRELVRSLLHAAQPFLAVCLSHQVLADHLGLRVEPAEWPHQGEQREVRLWGRTEVVGFYNTFVVTDERHVLMPEHTGPVILDHDPVSGHIVAMRAGGFASVQFHPESLLTRNGPAVLRGLVGPLLGQQASARDSVAPVSSRLPA
ncbi:MAG: hypothetical protein AUG44_16060 [Actinobacteria bacterium 13_1_20CM_3_71_11]|nr:MAG: hypothetical protein AUG44_16060 [Actinobacteria bacterium 13_1_20CM_3_71_11]